MENNQTAQKAIEQNGQKNYFFEHVKTRISERKENIISDFQAINNRLFNELSKDEFELLGMFSFLMGVDYTSQAYPNANTLKNVQKRFSDLGITDEMISLYFQIMERINKENSLTLKENEVSVIDRLFKNASDSLKNQYTNKIEVKNANKIELKLIKSNLNKFLDVIQVPIGYATGLVEFKKNDLTYESLLKANDILNNQGTYTGNYVKKFTELYGNSFFMELLNKASKYFNDTKFALIYEESIITVLESICRFPLCIDASQYTDEQYENMKNDYQKKQEEKLAEYENLKNKDKEVYESPKMTGEQVRKLMDEAPDEFIVLNLLDNLKQNQFNSANEIVSAIDSIIEQSDLVEHIFTYVKKNQDSPYRSVGATSIPNIEPKDIVNAIDAVIAIDAEKYKELAEQNCAEIPSEQLNHIVSLINEVIRGCVLKTQEQKQYLISQLMENGITTWNQLQQIMTIIETCDIFGESAQSYDNLYNYVHDKTNIVEVFELSKTLNNLQVKLSVYHAFKNWFNFHIVK